MSSLTAPIPPNLGPACRAGNTDLGTVPIGFVFLALTLVLVFAVFRDGRLGVRFGLGFFGLLCLSATIVAFRYHFNPFTRQVIFKPRWLTVTTKTARTREWSVRWRDIDEIVVRRAPDTAGFHLVFRPAEVVDSYYPRERLARPLGLARESDRSIVLSEIELTAEEIELALPGLREHVAVTGETQRRDVIVNHEENVE